MSRRRRNGLIIPISTLTIPLMNRRAIILILFIIPFALSAQVMNFDKASLQFQVDVGMGSFLGDFREHLEKSYALTYSPVLEGTLLIYPGDHWGLGLLMGSMTVIHFQSEPIEGIIRYQELMLEYSWGEGPVQAMVYSAVGFQDPGMSLEWYGSGVADLGIRAAAKTKENLALTLTLGYRFSFLRSILLAEKYEDIDQMDNLSSLRLCLGLRYSSK